MERIETQAGTYVCVQSGGDYGGHGYLVHLNWETIEEEAETVECSWETVSMGYSMEADIKRYGQGLVRQDLPWSLDRGFDYEDIPCEVPAAILARGDFGSCAIYILEDGPLDEFIEALESYPILDEDKLSEYEQECLNEQLPDILRYDLLPEIGKVNTEAEDFFSELDLDELMEWLEWVAPYGEPEFEIGDPYQCSWMLVDPHVYAEKLVDLWEAQGTAAFAHKMIRLHNKMDDLFPAQ